MAQNGRTPKPMQTATPLRVSWQAGVVQSGGLTVSIAAGALNVVKNKTNCQNYSSCNIIYANSSGTVAVTSTVTTAFASGNSILAFVTADNNGKITAITYPDQTNATAIRPAGITGSGTSCTITAIVNGVVTAGSCS
jgi:hypothetical protein